MLWYSLGSRSGFHRHVGFIRTDVHHSKHPLLVPPPKNVTITWHLREHNHSEGPTETRHKHLVKVKARWIKAQPPQMDARLSLCLSCPSQPPLFSPGETDWIVNRWCKHPEKYISIRREQLNEWMNVFTQDRKEFFGTWNSQGFTEWTSPWKLRQWWWSD